MTLHRFSWGAHNLLLSVGLLMGSSAIMGGQIAPPTWAAEPPVVRARQTPQAALRPRALNPVTQPTETSRQGTIQQSSLSSTQLSEWLRRFRPPRSGQPLTTGNGSSRDGLRCNAAEPSMQPLLPADKYGWSLEARPEIFVDISETSATQALLIMRGENDTDYLLARLPITNTNGIVGFRLPDHVPALIPNQTYQWSLSFICGDYFTLNDPTITGWVRHIEKSPESEQVLNTRSAQEQAEWLSENGYWYDLAALLVAASE
ncbi:MAG: DUF928 domain-containing protein [Phormidesmis sp. RL_2_1]|nr:DUF928 domain-containing protein [Phormidesmis sp. RL_2_1]